MRDVSMDSAAEYFARGDFATTEKIAHQLTDQVPSNGMAWKLLGVALHLQGKPALSTLLQAEKLLPADADVKAYLGGALVDSGNLVEGEEKYRESIALDERSAQAHYNLGQLYCKKRNFKGSLPHFRKAADTPGASPLTLCALGGAAAHCGELQEAVSALRRTLAVWPDCVDAQYTLASVLLSQGHFEEGFALFESRWAIPGAFRRPNLACPIWDGRSSVVGKNILLYGEQGLGDTIQFMRFAKVLEEMGAIVSLGVRREIGRLAEGLGLKGKVYSGVASLPDFDFQCAAMSLPGLLGVAVNTIPWASGYLPGKRVRQDRTAPRVGIAWQGNPNFPYDWKRSIRLAELVPLFDANHVQFVSLQLNYPEIDREAFETSPLLPFHGDTTDLQSTADVVADLDIVIAIDSAIAHLAGALGVPCWLLLHEHCEWRWLLGRPDSPWYSSMRLFRRTEGESWTDLAHIVKQELRKIRH